MPPPRKNHQSTPTLRFVVAWCAVVASAGCIAASLLTWFAIQDASGRTTISGWGTVTGGQISGQNINDLGVTSFRPGGLAVVVGSLALLAALGIAVLARGPRPHRIPAAVLLLSGVTGLVWGSVRAVLPGTLDGTYSAREVSGGAGAWVTAGCSLILLTAAVVVFTGLLDPPKSLRRRGIQPR